MSGKDVLDGFSRILSKNAYYMYLVSVGQDLLK